MDRHCAGSGGRCDVVLRTCAGHSYGGAGHMRPVTVGIIGAGNVIWAYFQVLDRLLPRGLARMGPVCARRQETWQDFQTRRPGIQLVANPAEVLQSDVDVVLIITPPESHSSLVRLALEHGKHVVVEKPSAATRCEAQQLAMQAQERDLHLLCAPVAQLALSFRALWEGKKAGATGKVDVRAGLYGDEGSSG